MADTFGERLKKAMRARKKRSGEVAAHMRLDRPGTVSDWQADRIVPGLETAIELARFLNVNGDWFFLGVGQMDRTAPGDEAAGLLAQVQELAQEIERLTAKPTAPLANVDPALEAKLNRAADTALQNELKDETTRPRNEQRRLPKQAIGNLGS